MIPTDGPAGQALLEGGASTEVADVAPLPRARSGTRPRTPAPSAGPAFGSAGSGARRNPRSGGAASSRSPDVSGAADVVESAASPAGTSAAAAACRRLRSELCGRGTRSMTFGRRRRSRLRRSLCGAPASASGSGLRQSSTSVAPGVTAGSSVAAALRARPVICPLRRSVSYQSSSAAPEREVYSSRRSRRTVASGGGLSDRRPVPESLSIDAQIR